MIRPVLSSISRQAALSTRGFRTFAPTFVKAGASVPNVPVQEGSPGNNVNLAEETAKVSLLS